MKRLLSKERIYWLAIILLAILIHRNHYINADEGVILNGAWNIVHGRIPYLDYFSFIPPLSSFLVAAVFSLTGAAFWAAKGLAVIFLLLGTIAVFRLCRRISAGWVAYLAPIIFLLATSWHWIINHNFFNIVAILWSLDCLLAWRQEKNKRYFFISAVIAGISILFLQQKGLVFLGSTLLWVFLDSINWKDGLRKASQYLLASLAPVALLLFFFPLTVLYEQLIIFPLFNYVETNRLPLHLFWLAIIALFAFLWDRRYAGRGERLLHLTSALLLLSCLPLPDAYHLSVAFLPLVPSIASSLIRKKTVVTWVYLSIFAFLTIYPASRYAASLFEPGSRMEPGFISFIERNCPGRYLHSGPFFPNAYYECRKLSASSYDILITGHQTEEQFRIAEEEIRRNKPSCAVRAQIAARFKHNFDNPVDRLLDEEYELAFEDAWASVWMRK